MKGIQMTTNPEPQPEPESELDFPFQEWVDLYRKGELSPAEFVSEMEFDGFDGDLTDFL
jgi:hypothetical protein